MSIFYSEEKREFSGAIKCNPNKAFKTHYGNMLMLDFIAKNSTDGVERATARHELTIAHRKMEYWQRDRLFNNQQMLLDVAKLKADWRVK